MLFRTGAWLGTPLRVGCSVLMQHGRSRLENLTAISFHLLSCWVNRVKHQLLIGLRNIEKVLNELYLSYLAI